MRTWLHSFDRRFGNRIKKWPPKLRRSMLVATLIGQPVFTIGVSFTVFCAGFFYEDGRISLSAFLALLTIGFSTAMKLTLRRKRPLNDYVLSMRFDTFSFPSGHAAGSMVAYGMLAAFGWFIFPFAISFAVSVLVLALVVYIGLSRVYLGAHYPSDVLAGWLLGLVGLYAIVAVLEVW